MKRCKMLPVTLAVLSGTVLNAQDSRGAMEAAKSALAAGKPAEAGQNVDGILREHASDVEALTLKGVILDSQQRQSEAEKYYLRALQLAPRSLPVLNNLANHFLARGDHAQARQFYLKALAIDPHHVNANLQLAQMSVEDKDGGKALGYLAQAGEAANSEVDVALLRARALAAAGQCSDAAALLDRLGQQAGASASLFFSAGMTFGECKLYERAEQSFSRVLDAAPADADVLYNLGLAALHAGHFARAAEVLGTVLQQRPADPDALYALAQVYVKQERRLDAAALLTKAQKAAPGRPDVVLLLAQVSAQLEFFVDAAQSYEAYLKLKPSDDVAQREHSFMLACSSQMKGGVEGLEQYVRKHPNDAIGFYELGVARSGEHDRKAAFQSLDRALQLNANLAPARYARALLNLEEQKPQQAVEDLRLYLKREPKDYRALAHLGQAYLALERAGEAAEVLKTAVDLAPDSPLALVQYRRALMMLGRKAEATAVVARLKQSASGEEGRRPQAGLIEYLNLSPADRRARYLANLRNQAALNPGDPRWKLRLGRELLLNGKTREGLDLFEQLHAGAPGVLAECGRILLGFDQYEAARGCLRPAVSAEPELSAARLDLAIAQFHLDGPQSALAELELTPTADRQGDYYLLRAQVLDAQGQVTEAVRALNQGLRAAPIRPDLYLQATGFLVKHNMLREAIGLLEQAATLLPNERELLLAEAVTLELLRREDDAGKLLRKIQARWPEWDKPYVLSGMLLENQLKSAEARQLLETAIALGANTPEVYYYQARAIRNAAPEDLPSAKAAITHARTLAPNDPYILLLAGKIALAEKAYPEALERLLEAKRLQPKLVSVHYALRDTYKALGDGSKSAAELEEIKRLAGQDLSQDTNPFSMENFLFEVRPPS